MSRLNSFHLPPGLWPHESETVLLDGPEARHMLQVLRTPEGSLVRLFDGRGREGLFELVGRERKAVRLAPRETTVQKRPAAGLTLAIGWNKSSRRGWLLEKAVELGARGLAFWKAERSQGNPPPVKEKWGDKLIQSAKQCGSVWLPELHVLDHGVDGVVAFAREHDRRFLLWESPQAPTLLRPSMLAGATCLAVLGPEGGLSDQEVERFTDAGFEAVSLGPNVLRWETAALHSLSLALYGSAVNGG